MELELEDGSKIPIGFDVLVEVFIRWTQPWDENFITIEKIGMKEYQKYRQILIDKSEPLRISEMQLIKPKYNFIPAY